MSRFVVGLLAASALTSCGIKESTLFDTKIVGGIEARADEFPMVVRITYRGGSCSGTLLNPTAVLTAAHCVDPALSATDEIQEDLSVFIHPQYWSEWWKHDVAIVVYRDPIANHPVSIANSPPALGSELTIVGYGLNDLNGQSDPSAKRYGKNVVRSISPGRIEFIGRDSNSAGELGENVLNGPGDSGGPMFVNGHQVGVSSSISAVSQGGLRTGNYTDLNYPPNRKFLEETTRQNNIEIVFE